MNARIILFTRYPTPGQVKTRLIPSLGGDGAAFLHCRLTERMVSRMRSPLLSGASAEVRFTGGTKADMEKWLGLDCSYRLQCEGDLGDRLRSAFANAFDDGVKRVIAIGSDVPDISAEMLSHALERLESRDVIIGPTFDGGYYLIGMSRFIPELFAEISWGTETVFAATLARAAELTLTYDVLVRLSDVDRPEDLDHVQEFLES